jgi:DNA-binding response OmpR family regulator
MKSIRILVAEDDRNLRSLLKKYLENEGYSVFSASDGEAALDIWYENPLDLAILDVMMPNMNGWEVLGELRKESSVPVIMLTAKREEADRLQGFELGTDDYITKPFSTKELIMRVKALLKRSGKLSVEDKIELSGIVIGKSTRTVSIDSTPVSLAPKELDLLLYLVDNKDHVLTRIQILDRIWGYDYDGDTRVLDTTVKRLRKKMGPLGKIIKTVRGMGYILGDVK